MAGFLEGLLGGGGDLYGGELGDVLSPAQRNAIQARGLLAMAGAFGDAAMPSRLPVPIGAVLGKAAGALGTGQDAAMEAAIKNALTVQQIKAARLKMQQQTDFLNQPSLNDLMTRLLAGGGPGVSTSPGVPAPGTYAGGGDGAPPGFDILRMGSDFASGLSPTPPTATSRFSLGERQYPGTPDDGLAVGGRGLLAAPDAGLSLQTPTDRYRPGGALDPFAYGAPRSDTAGAAPKAQATRAAGEPAVMPESYWDQQRATGQLQGPLAAGGSGGGAPPVAPPEAGGDDTISAVPDTVVPPGGGGLLGVSPDLYRPVEASPFARAAPTPGDPRGVAPWIQARSARWNVDPETALKVARSEGLAKFSGDNGRSGGAFQLYTGGGLGNEFQKETGLDPLDPKNELATIDWALRNANRTGWGPYHGAAKVGVGPRTGLAGGSDQMVPSADSNLPIMRAQYAPGGGAPAPGGTAAVGGAQVPLPAGVDPARYQALMLELADRSAKAEILGLGNPYGPMLQILQNSPQYQAATEFAKRNAVLPLIQEESRQKALGGFETDIATRGFQANLDRVTQQIKAMGDAALAPAEILVNDGKGGTVKVQGTQLQRALISNGFSVPELGIKGLYGAAPPNAIPGLSAPGQSGQAAPSPQTQEASPAGGVPVAGMPAAGMPARVPFYTEPEIAQQKGDVEANIKRETDYRAAADAAQKTKTTVQGISADLANVVKGPFSQAWQTIARYGQLVDPNFKLQAQSYENATSAVNELVRQAVRASDPNPTFQQTKMAIDAMPQPNLTEGGIEKITGRMIGLQNHEIARAEALQQFKDGNRGSTSGFDSYWRQNVSPYAFVVTQMSEGDQKLLRDHLLKTVQGRAELQTLGQQLQFISRYTH